GRDPQAGWSKSFGDSLVSDFRIQTGRWPAGPSGNQNGLIGFSRKTVALVHGRVHLCNERGQKADPSDDGQTLSLEQVRSAYVPELRLLDSCRRLIPVGANEIDPLIRESSVALAAGSPEWGGGLAHGCP